MPNFCAAFAPEIGRIAIAVRDAGGRAVIVGGWVRDHLLGHPAKDIDIELFGLEEARVESLLARFGRVRALGRAFGVFRIDGIDADFSLPRRDSKCGPGHRGFDVVPDPNLTFAEAARRRDLTVNSIGLDPLTAEVLDPYGGCADLERGALCATDPAHFSEDPLRGLRVAQFAARLEMTPDDTLLELCRRLDLSELSGVRIFKEFEKMLLRAAQPARGLRVLEDSGQLHYFPELAALRGVIQDPESHPEGDVWIHTLMALDAAAALDPGPGDRLALMFGVLCHDLGKLMTTTRIDDRIRAPGHDIAGVAPTRTLLKRMQAPHALIDQVAALVEHHLAPARFADHGATAPDYRRLVRTLERAGVSVELLAKVARADHLGRTTAAAVAGRFDAGDTFLAAARTHCGDQGAAADAVLGRHLMARGLPPGPQFTPILERCRDIQDETGWADPGRILDRALADP